MSNPNPHRDSGFRGGGGGGGYNPRGRGRGGRGGYRPRRYWDNDDYYKKDRDYEARRRRRRRRSRSKSYSRSPSRSKSRSYSRSKSRSPERSPRRSDEYQPKSVPGVASPFLPEQYEPYIPQKPVDSGSNMMMNQGYGAQSHLLPGVANGNDGGTDAVTRLVAARDGWMPIKQQDAVLREQRMLPPQEYLNAPVPAAYNPQEEYGGQGMYNPNVAYVPTPVAAPVAGVIAGAGNSNPSSAKKKKDRKKKKKRQRSTSTSSSSSSSSSSDSDAKGKRKRRGSGSSSSSEGDRKESKTKKKKVTSEQRKALLQQRDNYTDKLKLLENSITKLMSKELELRQTNADQAVIDENKKLQAELRGRSKAVVIVLEKINDILQEKPPTAPSVVAEPRPKVMPMVAPPPPQISHPHPPQQLIMPQQVPPPMMQPPPQIHLPPPQLAPMRAVEQYEFFDSCQHWCRLCNVFPDTLQTLLDHFHTPEHQAQVEQLGIDEKPWRKLRQSKENKPPPGAKKIPFKGTQFFSPVQGWFCRICDAWMGDHSCATDHLKSDEHINNYTNFLAEHPEWESKWFTDREKARMRCGLPSSKQEAAVIKPEPQGYSSAMKTQVSDIDENGKSIRIQMRNLVKSDDSRSTVPFIQGGLTGNLDSAVDEWMEKPQKVKLDFDTQKFAAIVRQKHGHKDKEADVKGSDSEKSKANAAGPNPSPSYGRDRDRDSERDRDRTGRELDTSRRHNEGRRYGETFNARDRDRFGNRTRRRSRSRSKSRSRERYRRRSSPRGRSRSRSPRDRQKDRSPDRHDRRGNSKDKDKTPEVKEAAKKLPMIGKMPLYKKPAAGGFGREKSDGKDKSHVPKELIIPDQPPVEPLVAASISRIETSSSKLPASLSNFGVNSVHARPFKPVESEYGSAAVYNAYESINSTSSNRESYSESYEEVVSSKTILESVPTADKVVPEKDGTPLVTTGTGLPDDFQQALDIIYAPPEKQAPAPTTTASSTFQFGGSATSTVPGSAYEYASAYGTYGSYHQPPPGIITSVPPPSYDYGAGGYEGPPGDFTNADLQASDNGPPTQPPGMDTDEMEDLRMLGIDVDDIAAAALR